MSADPPQSPVPNVTEIEMELRRRPHGLSEGQIAFDVLAGLLCPLALLWSDPAVFFPTVAPRGCLPTYWAFPSYVVAGILALCLLVWLIAGPNHPRLGMLLTGPFALGALLWLALAVKLLPFALVYSTLLSGLLAFTPWFTSVVFLVNCVRAARAGSERSGVLTGFLLLFGCGVPLVLVLMLFGSREHQAQTLEALLFSSSPADREHAVESVRAGAGVDFARIALSYEALSESDPLREQVATDFISLSGMPITEVLRRLHRDELRPPSEQEPEAAAVETAQEREERLLDDLFSTSDPLALEATDELLGAQNLDSSEIVARYLTLAQDDPRRARVEKAYRQIFGDDIGLAVERMRRDHQLPDTPVPEPPGALAPGR